jgi:hypothetical protein
MKGIEIAGFSQHRVGRADTEMSIGTRKAESTIKDTAISPGDLSEAIFLVSIK